MSSVPSAPHTPYSSWDRTASSFSRSPYTSDQRLFASGAADAVLYRDAVVEVTPRMLRVGVRRRLPFAARPREIAVSDIESVWRDYASLVRPGVRWGGRIRGREAPADNLIVDTRDGRALRFAVKDDPAGAYDAIRAAIRDDY